MNKEYQNAIEYLLRFDGEQKKKEKLKPGDLIWIPAETYLYSNSNLLLTQKMKRLPRPCCTIILKIESFNEVKKLYQVNVENENWYVHEKDIFQIGE